MIRRMKTKDVEDSLPQGLKIDHIRLGKGGVVICALAHSVLKDGKRGFTSVLYDRCGKAYVRSYICTVDVPDEIRSINPGCHETVFMNGWKYNRDRSYDLDLDKKGV
ncbi:MAG: hypothetical protein J5957_01040 [Prevotella sp.]|nr:hypothetical protein [Prevotella sp.]